MHGDLLHVEHAGLDFGVIQDVVQDVQQGQRGLVDGAQHAGLCRVESGGLQDVHHAHHAVHGGADLVAHIGQKIGLGLVRLLSHLFNALVLGNVGHKAVP